MQVDSAKHIAKSKGVLDEYRLNERVTYKMLKEYVESNVGDVLLNLYTLIVVVGITVIYTV